jgi:maltose alpha-D-glucosyltransferase/alpha-amylase
MPDHKQKIAVELEDNPLWYKDAVVYEIPVKAYYDSNGDGIGDFQGLTEKLDYLQDLGITTIWLLPFYPSPLRDDGYDISDYTAIHPAYGNFRDFKRFMREAHRRGLRVVTELVLNHTSDQHPWFQRARRATAKSQRRNFYVWNDTRQRYQDTRIIFQDFETSNWTWDSVAKAYYWHRFYSHQPDLNFDNPRVEKAMFRVIDFWLQAGVDGLRLDAVPYLYEREGTNCENLPQTHEFLKRLRSHVDDLYNNRMLLAEANQWPEDAVSYFGDGDECHMAFHFPLMPRLFMALRMEERFPIIDIMEQTPTIPTTCQWALFLRNHDELTLEMVTDEERDYMWRVYGHDPQMRVNLGIRRRLTPLLENNRRQVELLNSLLFSLPGTPVVYYGDEIGMGDNVYLGDRGGVRTPMQWSADRNAGFSRANPHRLYLPINIDPEYHYEAIHVEAQQRNTQSLLWWMKRLISFRKGYKAFGNGTIEFLFPENRKILVFIRSFEDERILVVANLSQYVQYAELDLSPYKGMVPREMFGRSVFPPIGELPYFLTLGPHAFYWFSLVPQEVGRLAGIGEKGHLPAVTVTGKWELVFRYKTLKTLEGYFVTFLPSQRWFWGKVEDIKSVRVREVIPLPGVSPPSSILLLEVTYLDGNPDLYAFPVALGVGDHAEEILRGYPQSVVARVMRRATGEEGLLYDAMVDQEFCVWLLNGIGKRRQFKGTEGRLMPKPTKIFWKNHGKGDGSGEVSFEKAEHSNTLLIYRDQFVFKLFRLLNWGKNPDVEIGKFLTDKGFPNIAPIAGSLEYSRDNGESMSLGILSRYVQNQGDAWKFTLDALKQFFERVLVHQEDIVDTLIPRGSLLELAAMDLLPEAGELIGVYLESVKLLGQRTAELHLVLSSEPNLPDFAPEPFSKLYQRALYQTFRIPVGVTFQLLRQHLEALPEDLRERAQWILSQRREILACFRAVLHKKITAVRVRCHGNYHLKQVLYTGKDFVIIDFEGEIARPLSERRIKRSPLRDVASMIRSFHYAAYSALHEHAVVRSEDVPLLEQWVDLWYQYVSSTFLRSYLDAMDRSPCVPQESEDVEILLHAFLLEKGIYELGYEINNRPDWISIPIKGIEDILRISQKK